MRLIIFSGLPGTGKSMLAEAVGRVLGIPVFAKDWRQLADQYHADYRIIECICSDESLHRLRLSERQRKIPGWHELEWSEVERVKEYYVPWEGEHLVLDMTNSFTDNFLKTKTYCE